MSNGSWAPWRRWTSAARHETDACWLATRFAARRRRALQHLSHGQRGQPPRRGELTAAATPSLVRQVLDRCRTLVAATGGFFDVGARRRLRPVGARQGLGRAARRGDDEAAGFADFCLTVGGDSSRAAAHGPRRTGRSASSTPSTVMRWPPSCARTTSPWPRRAPTSAATTSSTRMRRPAAGRPVRHGRRSGPRDRRRASTAAFAMGDAGPGWTLGLKATRP